MTCLDKIKQVEKVAESYLRFETGYAAPIRKRIQFKTMRKFSSGLLHFNLLKARFLLVRVTEFDFLKSARKISYGLDLRHLPLLICT